MGEFRILRTVEVGWVAGTTPPGGWLWPRSRPVGIATPAGPTGASVLLEEGEEFTGFDKTYFIVGV